MERKKLEDFCIIIAGGDAPKDNFSKEKTSQFNIPIISNGKENNAIYGYTDIAKIDTPSISISARGTIGYCMYHENPFYPIVRLICITPNNTCITKFLKYYFDTVDFNIPKIGIPQLTIPMVKDKKIPLPPTLPEQQKIASFLASADELIDAERRKVEALKKYKKGLMQKLFPRACACVPDLRFPEFQTSGEWEEKKLEELCSIKKGEQKNKLDLIENGKYPVLNGGITFSGYCNSYNREANTIAISEGGSCGYVNFIKTKFWSSGHCYTLHDVSIDTLFLYQCLKFNENKIMKLGIGTGIKNIPLSYIKEFSIQIPSLEEQQKIAEVLSTADELIDLENRKLETLKKYKKGLMQKLFPRGGCEPSDKLVCQILKGEQEHSNNINSKKYIKDTK